MSMLEWCDGCGNQLKPVLEGCELCTAHILAALEIIESL